MTPKTDKFVRNIFGGKRACERAAPQGATIRGGGGTAAGGREYCKQGKCNIVASGIAVRIENSLPALNFFVVPKFRFPPLILRGSVAPGPPYRLGEKQLPRLQKSGFPEKFRPAPWNIGWPGPWPPPVPESPGKWREPPHAVGKIIVKTQSLPHTIRLENFLGTPSVCGSGSWVSFVSFTSTVGVRDTAECLHTQRSSHRFPRFTHTLHPTIAHTHTECDTFHFASWTLSLHTHRFSVSVLPPLSRCVFTSSANGAIHDDTIAAAAAAAAATIPLSFSTERTTRVGIWRENGISTLHTLGGFPRHTPHFDQLHHPHNQGRDLAGKWDQYTPHNWWIS